MTTSETVSWRRLAVLPLVVFVASVVIVNAAGWLIDASSLRQAEDSWGYAFGAFFLSLYASPVLFVCLGSAIAGRLSSHAGAREMFAWIGAGVCAVAGVGVAVLVLPSGADTPADVAFACVVVALGLLLVVPAALCARQSLRQRASA